jgi:hypothetical protein
MISSATLIRRTGAALFSAATLFVPARGADQVTEVRLYALDWAHPAQRHGHILGHRRI